MATLQSTLRMSLLDDVSRKASVMGGALNGLSRQVNGFMGPLRGLPAQLLAFGGAYIGVTEGIGGSFKAASDAQAALTEIGIKADLSSTQLQQMDQRLQALAPNVNQLTSDLRGGVDTMLTMGMSADAAMGSIGAIGKAATATGTAVTDLSSASVSAMQNFGVLPSEIGRMLDGMATAGDAGAFELKNMAQYFPQLTASARTLGLEGVKGINDMSSALQIAMRGAGDYSTAANNLSQFMSKIISPQTIKNFKKFGVDVTKELEKANKKGISPIEHFIKLIDQKTKGGRGDLVAQIFGDEQAMNFIRPMLADMTDYLRIRDQADRANGTVAEAYNRRMQDANQKIKAFQISMQNLGTAIGGKMLGPVSEAAQELADIFNTLDQRFTIFDRVKSSMEGFWSGLGGDASSLGESTKALKEFIFGVEDGGKAADQYGLAFKQFREFGQDVKFLTDAVRDNPFGKFLTDVGIALAAFGMGGWGRLLLIGYGISAVVKAAEGAESIGDFVEGLKDLSTLELAGVAAGLLLIGARAKSAIDWLGKLRGASGPAGTGGTAGAGGKPGGKPTGQGGGLFSLANLFGFYNAWSLVNDIPDTAKGVEEMYAANKKRSEGWNGWLEKNVGAPNTWFPNLITPGSSTSVEGVSARPDQVSPFRAAPADDGSVSARENREERPSSMPDGWWNWLLFGSASKPDFNFREANGISLQGGREPITAETLRQALSPPPVQDVRVTNSQPPSVTVHAPITITGVIDPRAAAAGATQQLGEKVRAAVEGAYTD